MIYGKRYCTVNLSNLFESIYIVSRGFCYDIEHEYDLNFERVHLWTMFIYSLWIVPCNASSEYLCAIVHPSQSMIELFRNTASIPLFIFEKHNAFGLLWISNGSLMLNMLFVPIWKSSRKARPSDCQCDFLMWSYFGIIEW